MAQCLHHRVAVLPVDHHSVSQRRRAIRQSANAAFAVTGDVVFLEKDCRPGRRVGGTRWQRCDVVGQCPPIRDIHPVEGRHLRQAGIAGGRVDAEVQRLGVTAPKPVAIVQNRNAGAAAAVATVGSFCRLDCKGAVVRIHPVARRPHRGAAV